MDKVIRSAAPLLLFLQISHSFVPQTTHVLSSSSLSCPTTTQYKDNNCNNNRRIDLLMSDVSGETAGVEMVSLASLGNDHEAVGESIAKSLADWLDDEWMPQEVHIKMGVSVKNTYITCRSNGVDDIATIMTDVTDDLYESWEIYDKDAFVNAWDIGNYVSDFLIAKSGAETCGCATKISE